jgi:hypothetical protein
MSKIYTFKTQVLTALVLFCSVAAMATNTAIVSGNWETGTNWSSGTAPLATDVANIPAGITMTVTVAGDVCSSLTIAGTGTVIINAAGTLAIGGNFGNAGTFTAAAGSQLIFNGAANSVISGGGTYSIAATVVMNMGTAATTLDVQDANFITGINAGAKYYFTFTQGTWRMDNNGLLNDAYNSGSNNALTIPFGVVLESDAGTMNLSKNAPSGSAILSGKLFLNGGTVNVQTGQSFNSGQDFRYSANGGTPQLYVSNGTLNVGAGFNANSGTDYIDFHMTGGVLILAVDGYSNWITFQLADVLGGKTFMTGGQIILQDACNANIEDLDMGGANVAATQYLVTGGTVKLGYISTQAGSTFFGIDAQPTTNYPNIDFEAGSAKTVSAFNGGNLNVLSLFVNANMTFDATGFPNVNIMGNNGIFALDDEGGFIQSTNTITFSGSVPQLITSVALANETFYNLNIANTSGHVILGVATTVNNQLAFTSGILDATAYPLTISNGSVPITGVSATSYVITGNGVGGANQGYLNITNIPANTNTLFPIGNATYYLPATLNPGANVGNSYNAFVFTGATSTAVENGLPFSAALLSDMVNAVWNIQLSSGSSGSTALSLNWGSSGTALEGASFQTYGTNIGISRYESEAGGPWTPATGSGSVASATATSSFTTMTQFAVTQLNFALPVILTDFNAVLNNSNRTVLLSWSASDGVDIRNFDVQKSTNGGSTWNSIGIVLANTDDAGESNYSLVDPSPVDGMNDYRVIIHNLDGALSYSAIKAVALSAPAGISIFPIPANNRINVSVGNATSSLYIRLISQTGQVMQTAATGGNGSSVTSINTSNTPSGVYFLQIMDNYKVVQISSVLIAH